MGIFHVGLNHFLGLSALLLGLGLYGVITGKNELSWLIGVLLMFSSINISLGAFSRFEISGSEGQVLPVFTIIIISIQIAVAASIAMRRYRNKDIKENNN